jgi:hypothetical protein
MSGADYYAVLRMPTLMHLPMVVTATWSLQLPEVDRHGIHGRKHFLQFREEGLYDPELRAIDQDFLYSRSAVPDWLVFDELEEMVGSELIRSKKELSSVEFVQDRRKRPSYFGGLFMIGNGYMGGSGGEGTISVGAGFAIVDEIFEFRRLPDIRRISLEVSYQPTVGEEDREIISPYLAFQVHVPKTVSLHIESGYAYGLKAPYKQSGARAAFGLCTPTLPLGFTYIGAIARLKYEVLYLEEIVQGFVIEMVLH